MIHSSKRDQWARVISDILNPLLLPILVFTISGFKVDGSASQMLVVIGISVTIFLIIPLFVALIIRRSNKFQTLDFRERTSRKWLYLSSILSVSLGILIFDEIFNGVF